MKVGEEYNMTKIYIADVSCLSDEKIFNELYLQVSQYRQTKIDRLCLMKDKNLSLGVGFLFKKACLDFGIPYEKTKIIFNEYGKPSFENNVKFNLSHSGTKVMCMMSEYEVGCDVEQIRKVNMKIAKRYFSDAEYAFIMNSQTEGKKMDAFYRIWTLKESYIKCTGEGLSLPLKNFSVSLDGVSVLSQACIKDDQYSFFEYDYVDGYRCACCIKNMYTRSIPQVINFNFS